MNAFKVFFFISMAVTCLAIICKVYDLTNDDARDKDGKRAVYYSVGVDACCLILQLAWAVWLGWLLSLAY